MNDNQGNALMLLNMTLEDSNSAPSVHLMTGVIEAVAQAVGTLYVVTRPYDGVDCAAFARIKEGRRIVHAMTDVASVGKANVAMRYLNDVRHFRQALGRAREFKGVRAIFVQSSVNPAAAVHYARKAFPDARVTYNAQDIYSEAAVCRGMIGKRSPLFRALASLEAAAYRNSDCVITVSHGMAETIAGTGCDLSKVAVVHNWAYRDDPVSIPLEQNDFARQNGLDDGKFKVVYAGNVGALQGVETLMDAATLLGQCEDIEFVIVGDGLRGDAMRRSVTERHLRNVRLFDRQSSRVVEQVYSLADLNVISLIGGMTRAALPSKTAICLACGRPILLAVDKESTYAKSMLATRNCILCSPGDAHEMAAAILKAAETREPCNPEGSRDLFREQFCGEKNKARYRDLILGTRRS